MGYTRLRALAGRIHGLQQRYACQEGAQEQASTRTSTPLPPLAEAKSAITIPCAVVPLPECTVDAGCKADNKGGKCEVDPAAPPANCTALMSSSGASLATMLGSQPWTKLQRP